MPPYAPRHHDRGLRQDRRRAGPRAQRGQLPRRRRDRRRCAPPSRASPFTLQARASKGALLLVCDGMGGAAAGEVASQMAVDSIYDALAAAEPQPRDGFARLAAPRRRSTPTSASSSSRATTRASAAWAPPAPSAALVDETLVVAPDRRLALLRPARRQAGAGDQGSVAGLAADRGRRDDRRGGQGLRARQHHPAGAGRAGARRGGAVAGARCARATSSCSARTACTARSADEEILAVLIARARICRRRARR